MRKVNAALFGASWFPYASFETLKVATLLSIWVIKLPQTQVSSADILPSSSFGTMVGNPSLLQSSVKAPQTENDSSDFSSLVHDYQAAAAFRADTRSFIRQCLYPQEDGCRGFTATNPIIVGFQEVGDAIRQSYDRGQAFLIFAFDDLS